MSQAANIISFPLDGVSTDLLHDFMSSPSGRLDEIVQRLEGMSGALSLIRAAIEDDSPLTASAIALIDFAVQDCIRIAELRPVAQDEVAAAAEPPQATTARAPEKEKSAA